MADINTNAVIDFDDCATDNATAAGSSSSQETRSASSSSNNNNGSGVQMSTTTKAEPGGGGAGAAAPWEHQDVLLSNAGLPEANPLLDFGEMEEDFQKMLNDWENHIGIGPTTLPHVSLEFMLFM